MRFPWSKPKPVLTPEQRSTWERDGFLVLERFFTEDEIRAVNDIVENKTRNPAKFGEATIDVLHGEWLGKRLKARTAPAEAFEGPVKINDLFLEEEAVRRLAVNPRLSRILSDLLDGDPIVCNSLNFLWGSQQPDHFDSWYMPPAIANKMLVSSICLEDVAVEAGPLAYYPGSHKIEPYRFSHGGIHAINEEMPQCREYVDKTVKEAGCERRTFLGKAGDVFIWHGQLLHGGTPITDMKHTRKTLVTHYWRMCDVEPERVGKVDNGGYYLKREYHAAAS